jgi:catechol 2,3-dioxygenase-like lactoylglutathione lyase family enzyme
MAGRREAHTQADRIGRQKARLDGEVRTRTAGPYGVTSPLPSSGRPAVAQSETSAGEGGITASKQQPSSPLGDDAAVTHILVVSDPARSRDFWIGVLGAELFREYGGTSVVLSFAGTWLLLVTGGGPTADKPGVVFQPPADAARVSHAITVRVADCQAAYEALRSRGATFLTPPHDWGAEIRCFLRDPDGHLVEISQLKAT